MIQQIDKSLKGVFRKNEWLAIMDALYDYPVELEYCKSHAEEVEMIKPALFETLRRAELHCKSVSKQLADVEMLIEKLDWFTDRQCYWIYSKAQDIMLESDTEHTKKFIATML